MATCWPGCAPEWAGAEAVATRALERGGLERHLVARAEVLATDATGVLARTAAYRDPWPQGPFPPPPDRSRPREGRLRIEAVADTVLRVRYASGPEVRDGGQGMLTGAPPPAASVEVAAAPDRVVLRTPAMTAVASLDPYRLEVRGAAGAPAGSSGPATGACSTSASTSSAATRARCTWWTGPTRRRCG